jgi:tRNA-dihydrouridine synthase
MKKHLSWYIKGMSQASQTRQKFFAAASTAELIAVIDEYQASPL